MKKLDRFNEIKNIVLSSSKAELETMTSYIKSVAGPFPAVHDQAVKLLDTLTSKPKLQRQEVLKKIGMGTANVSEANAFFLAVRGYLLDSFTLDISIEKPGEYNNHFRNKAANTKKIIQSEILLGKGLVGESRKLLEEVSSRAMKYEEYQQALEAFRLLQLIHIQEKGLRTYNRFEGYIKEASELRAKFEASKHIYIGSKVYRDRNDEEGYRKYLEDAVAKLNGLLKGTPISNTAYIRDLLQFELQVLNSEFTKARKTLEDALDKVRNSPAVQSSHREGHLLIDLSTVLTQLRKLPEARNALELAGSISKKSSFEYYVVTKHLMYLDFYQKKYDELQDNIQKQIKSKYTRRVPFASAQFHFLKAVLDFLTGNPKATCKNLLEELKVNTDISNDIGLGINFFLYMAACEIREEDKDLAKEAMDISKANLEEYYENEELRKRDRSLIRMFRRLDANECDFNKTIPLIKSSLERLDSSDPELRWEPFKYEVFPFNEWMKAKGSVKRGFKLPAAPKA